MTFFPKLPGKGRSCSERPDRYGGPSENFQVLIDSDDEDNVLEFGGEEIPDVDDDDVDDFVRELTPGEVRELQRARSSGPNLINRTQRKSDCINTSQGFQIKRGMSVELADGDFLYVDHITVEHYQPRALKGILLRRTKHLNDMLPKRRNELCAILQIDSAVSTEPMMTESLVSIPPDSVITTREIIFTNQDFPACSFYKTTVTFSGSNEKERRREVEDKARLVCRWKSIELCDVSKGKVIEESLSRLTKKECTFGEGVPDVELKRSWRCEPERAKGAAKSCKPPGSPDADLVEVTQQLFQWSKSKGRKRNRTEVDLTSDDSSDLEVVETTKKLSRLHIKENASKRRGVAAKFLDRKSVVSHGNSTLIRTTSRVEMQHTYGDLFSGAGGAACGAKIAGLKLQFSLDMCADACNTLHQNFPCARIFPTTVFNFCTSKSIDASDIRVDVIQISSPCQPHSPAHTVDGRNDEANIAAGFAVMRIIDLCRPRVVTLEQTSGIVTHRGGVHFRALIHQLTSMSYSVRWKILDCAEYGCVQHRKRLFIIAACPGEMLPKFPDPIHGSGPRCKPFVTIHDVLQQLSNRYVEPHMNVFRRKQGLPYDPRTQLRRCITTHGTDSDTHPGGHRTFTLRELACLAGFPWNHHFSGCKTSIKRQIGNAVPAPVAAEIFKEVVNTLRRSDARDEAWDQEVINVD